MAERCGLTELTTGSLPNVARWWADITGRDTWREVVAESNVAFDAWKGVQ